MNLFKQTRNQILTAVADLQSASELPAELPLDAITVEPPREASHGDMATNAAMVLAGKAGMKPRDIADKLAEKLRAMPHVTEVSVAGPGFINIRFGMSFWQQVLPTILEEGIGFGNSDIGKGVKVNVEYVSANPTGPMHVGHARGMVFGDALALLLMKAGYSVTKEYYINDAGAQVNVLGRSAYLRYREACGENIGEIPAGLYPGEYLKAVGDALKSTHGDKLLKADEEEWLPITRQFAIDAMITLIKQDLLEAGVEHDVFTSEAKLHAEGKIPAAIKILEGKGIIYRGVLEPPKGKLPEDWEEREQLLFKSTQFGDDIDRPLQKSDGNYTYFAADLAYAQDKIQRGFNVLVYVLGADHGGYKKRMEAAISALSDGKAECDVKLCQLVHLFKDGEPVKMSKRAGRFETVRDVLEAVGKGVLRFIMLTRKNDQSLDFDLDKVKEQSKDNPVFYVQYAHARCKSLLRLARDESPAALEKSQQPDAAMMALLATDGEMTVIRKLAEWPRAVEAAAISHEPHRIAYFLQELAASFHGLWNQGRGDAALRFVVKENEALTAARLALARAIAVVVASGLMVLGVEPVEELRG